MPEEIEETKEIQLFKDQRRMYSACNCLDRRCCKRGSVPEEIKETKEIQPFKDQRRMYFYVQFFSINNIDTIAQKFSAYFYLKVSFRMLHPLIVNNRSTCAHHSLHNLTKTTTCMHATAVGILGGA